MDWLEVILRFISFWLDKLFYSFVPTVYNILMDIAETTIFTEEIFDMFASKVYALLGIFMLFKVSFSILTYIVDPDSFLDKSKGFSKLISNIIITLTLLIATPWIFSQAMEIQKIVLRDNVLGKIFSTTSVNPNVVADAGNVMSYETFKAFYHFDYDNFPACESDDGIFNDSEDCKNQLKIEEKYDILSETLNIAHNTQNINVYLNYDLLLLKGQNDNYVMYYIPIISTLAGVALLLLLIVFCFDVALRSVKLGFLRMIAPVPIISRIDPKKGKETFDKWVKTTIGTYLDLFIRLLAIYFAVFVITQVIDLKFVDAVTGLEKDVNVLVKVFIILGALLFAKQLPQLVQDLTGIKMDGKFTLNPMNKLRQVPLVGAGVTTATALAGGAYTGYKAGVQAGHAGRGLIQGMMGAGREIRGKVPLMGDDKGKSPRALHTGMQAGFKEITGKDYSVYSPWKEFGKDFGKDEIDNLKKSKYAIQGEQAKLDAQLQTFYDQLAKATTDEDKNKLNKAIEDNRSLYGKYAKNISSLDDQIKDIKRLYHIDDSPKKDVDDARGAAGAIMSGTQPKVTVELSTSGNSSGSSTGTTINTATSSSQVQTQNGGTVNVQKGEQYTSSGIIIGNDSNWNKK